MSLENLSLIQKKKTSTLFIVDYSTQRKDEDKHDISSVIWLHINKTQTMSLKWNSLLLGAWTIVQKLKKENWKWAILDVNAVIQLLHSEG